MPTNPKKKAKRLAPNPSDAPEPKTKSARRRLHIRADLAHGGSLHVRHLSDRDVQLDGVEVALGDADPKPVWIQLAKTGTFRGHPAGPFELNSKVFEDIVRNFKATQNRSIPIDFEHASEADPTQGAIPVDGAPAQGWIRDLRIDGGNLWGLVEWGDKARDYIRAGQYKFFSPAIRFGARDRVTGQQIGARMTSGALTNNPFLDGMKPLAAKDADGGAVPMRLAHAPHEYMSRLKAILRLPELCSARECAEHLERLRDHFDGADGNPDGTHEGVKLAEFCGPMRDLVDAPLGSTWDQVFEIVEGLIDAAIDEHEVEAHPEMTDDDNGAELTDAPQGDDSMFKDIAEATAKLSEAQAETSKLTLTLKDRDAKIVDLETEVKTLRDNEAKRIEADQTAEIEEAFATYKDAKKLSDQDKGHMLATLKAAPDAFRALFPKVAQEHRHLQRNLTEEREDAASTVIDNAEPANSESPLQTTKRLMKEKKLSYADAQNLALKLRGGR